MADREPVVEASSGMNRPGWRRRAALAAVLGTSAASLGVGLASAGASSAHAPRAVPKTSAHVVSVTTRVSMGHTFKNMLVTTAVSDPHHPGASLYFQKTGSCTGGCLTVWPPLLMPKGATTPTGAPNLGTKKFGTRLQVTFKGSGSTRSRAMSATA